MGDAEYVRHVMKRMMLREAGDVIDRRLVLEEADELPEPGQGEVKLRVMANGVCRTDLHIVEGELETPLPRVPGHQVVGSVEAVGEGVEGVLVGDRVGVAWLASTCGECVYCKQDRENLCERPRFTGRDRDGGYATQMLADAEFVFPLPASFSDVEAAPLLCAGVIGYRSLKISEIRPGGRLGLFGFGASAHLAIQVANHWGCDTYVYTRDEKHRRLGLDLGAVWAGEVADDPGVRLNSAVIFAPAGEIVPAALAKLDRSGTLAVNAVHMSDIPSFSYDILYWERGVRSVANFTRQDAREFLALAAEIPIHAKTETFPLEKANEALIRLKNDGIDGAAVLIP